MIETSPLAAAGGAAGADGAGTSVSAPGTAGGEVDACAADSGTKAPMVPIAAVARKWRRPISGRGPFMLILPLSKGSERRCSAVENADTRLDWRPEGALRPSPPTRQRNAIDCAC